MTRPLRSSPITGPSSLLRVGPPLCPASVPAPRGSAAWGSPFHQRPRATTAPLAARGRGTTGSHVPHQSPDQARATSMPDTTWPVGRHPPGSIPGRAGCPVLMSSIAVFDTSSVDRSRSPSWPTPDALTARLTPRTLTTTALDRSSSGWFAASPCRATAKDHRTSRTGPSISDAAPHQTARSSTSTSSLRSWHTLPTAFSQKAPVPDHPTVRTGPDRAPRARIFMPRNSEARRARPRPRFA
jgi:hypothetical protein